MDELLVMMCLTFGLSCPDDTAPANPNPAPAVQTAGDVVTGTDLDMIENLLSGYGSVTRTTDTEGDPKFEGRIDGDRYSVFFYGCDDAHDNCTDIQFSAYYLGSDFDITLEAVNAFNYAKRFGKAAMDSDGDLQVTHVVNLRHGAQRKTLDDDIDWWRVILEGVRETFDATP